MANTHTHTHTHTNTDKCRGVCVRVCVSYLSIRAGRVTSLVLGRQVSLARELMEVNRRGDRIHGVPK